MHPYSYSFFSHRLHTGDRILVRAHDAAEGHWFEGGVHVVRREEVGLRFHVSFRARSPSQSFNVRFKLNRYPLRRQHLAMDTVFTQARVMFPLKEHVPRGPYPKPNMGFKVFNPLIATNPPQLQAVISINRQAPGAVPFVIFGP